MALVESESANECNLHAGAVWRRISADGASSKAALSGSFLKPPALPGDTYSVYLITWSCSFPNCPIAI